MQLRHAALALLAACGGATSNPPSRPLGAQAHLDEAERHEADAIALDRQAGRETAGAAAVRCGDSVLQDQVTSGGERLIVTQPCWTAEQVVVDRHRETAQNLRAHAAIHRDRARALLAAEQAACAAMPRSELDHSPFAHREDVVAVTAILDSDRIRGARITMRKVPGLSAGWLRTAIGCHQARAAAIGWEPAHLAYDPSLVDGATVTVGDDGAILTIDVRADRPEVALVVYARAEALLGAHVAE